MKLKKNLLLLLSISFFGSCSHDIQPAPVTPTPPASVPNLKFQLSYEVDAQPVILDSIMYTTDAGYPYSIVTLNYFISQISLVKLDGTPVLIKDYHYASISDLSTDSFTIAAAPKGDYQGIQFSIGVDSWHNIADGLPLTVDNINMIWPDLLGGGYHFLKFEGNWKENTTSYGFAMHVGNNQNLIPVNISHLFSIVDNDLTLQLTMNINEWFRNPNTYDFITDGNYSMGNGPAMSKLAANGADVFHF